MRLQKNETQAEHTGPVLPGIDERPAFGTLDRKAAEYGKPIRMLAGGLDCNRVAVGIERRGMQQSRVNPRLVHFLQQVVLREDWDLAVDRRRQLTGVPDMDL